MRRRLFFVLSILLFLEAALFADSLDSLVLETGNDWYTLGLGNNLDDQVSYGGNLLLTQGNLGLEVALYGITDKIENQKRYDLLEASLSYALATTFQGFQVSAIPTVGITVSGNLGSQTVQNLIHTWLSRDLLTLTYEDDTQLYSPALGTSISIAYPFKVFDLGLEASYDLSIGWEQSAYAGAFVGIGDVLQGHLGYLWVDPLETDWDTHTLLSTNYTGLTLSYSFDGGLFQTSWVYHATGKTSYGSFGLDIMQFFAPKVYEHTDFTFSSGFLYDLQGQQNRLFSLTYKHIVFEIKHKNGPLFNLMEEQDTRMTIASWMGGYSKEFTDSGFVRPYGKFLVGLERYNLNYNYTESVIEELRPTVGIESGVILFPEGLLVTGSDTYRLKLSFSLQYIFGTEEIQAVDSDFAPHVTPWLFMAGIAFDIGHDLQH
jgi:hypothetical protein